MDKKIVDAFEAQNRDLAALFHELSGKHVYFFPNYGNAGDSLIAAATYQLLDHYNIEYDIRTTPDEASELKGECILLGGGGNLIPLYKGMNELLKAAIKGNNRVTLLPHSIRGHSWVLSKLTNLATIYCREAASYQYTQFTAKSANVLLGHDLGLFLDSNQLARDHADDFAKERFSALLKEKCWMTPEELMGSSVSCIRGGVEATIRPEGKNFDISVIFKGHVTPGAAELSAWMLHEFTRLCKEVTSNRLHVCIAAALAGTRIYMHDNNYGKVSGVYLQSMRDRFPNAVFSGEMVRSDPFSVG